MTPAAKEVLERAHVAIDDIVAIHDGECLGTEYKPEAHAALDAAVAAAKARMRGLMGCGHPRACFQERTTEERLYRKHCSACECQAAAVEKAVEEERERCAVVCENVGKEIVCPEECAAAIRAGGKDA